MTYTPRDAAPDLPTDATDLTPRDDEELATRVNDLASAVNTLHDQLAFNNAVLAYVAGQAAAAAPSSSVPRKMTDLEDVASGARGRYFMGAFNPDTGDVQWLDFSGVVAGTGSGQVANWPTLPVAYDLAPDYKTRATTTAGVEKVRCIDSDYSASFDATGGSGTGTWYVATTGSDAAGAGTKASPYRTINKAQAAASNGDKVVLRAGRYREQLGTLTNSTSTLNKNTTLIAYPHEEVWILGSIDVTNTTNADGLDVAWTSVPANGGWRLDLTVDGTVSGTNVFAATSGYPFHAGFVGAKVTGAGSGITVSSLKSATNGGANSTRYGSVNLAGTATNGAATITVGLGAAMNRTAGIASSGSVGYDAGLIATCSRNQTASEPVTIWCDGVKLKRVTYSSTTVLQPGQYMYDPTGQKVYLGTDPATCTRIEVGALGKFVGDTTTGGVTMKFWGVGVGHYGTNINPAQDDYAAIWLKGTGCEFVRSTCAHNHGYGISNRANNWKIRESLLLANGANAVHATTTDSGLIEQNRIAYNNDEFYEFGQGQGYFLVGTLGAVKCSGATTGIVMRLNIVHDNHSNGLWYDRAPGGGDGSVSQPSGAYDIIMVRNIVVNNDGYGIQNEINERVIVAGNLVVGNGRDGIKASSCPSARVRHNTGYGNGKYGQRADGSYPPEKWYTDTATNLTECIHWIDSRYNVWSNSYTGSGTNAGDVQSNVFISTNPSGTTGVGPAVIATRNQKAGYTKDGLTVIARQDYNFYGRTNANQPARLIDLATTSSPYLTRFATLAAWRSGAGSGRDTHSVEVNGIANIQSYFTDPTNGDYTIVAGSTADFAGAALEADVAAALNAATDASLQLALSAGDTPKIGAHPDWLPVPAWT